jgi:molybdate transport system substrate-binding protein
MSVRRWLGMAAVVATLAACSGSGASPTSPSAPSAAATSAAPASGVAAADLEIYGAASLKAVLANVKEAYEAANPGTTLTLSTDSSSALETKIEQGAPADVFLSADTTNPKKLVDGGFASGDVMSFAGNHLVVITPTDNPAGITSPKDLAKPGLKIIAADDKVPITKYATQLVENLAKEAGYPADFVTAYANNIASKEENVAGVVNKVGLGEGDAGIVYVTDARASDKVAPVEVPDSANVPATYGGVVVKASSDQAAATAFLDWLAGTDGQAILASFGFTAPSLNP